MPFLDLPQLHLPESGAYIFAVMVSPDDPIAQKTFMASLKGQVILNVLNKYESQELTGLPRYEGPSFNVLDQGQYVPVDSALVRHVLDQIPNQVDS